MIVPTVLAPNVMGGVVGSFYLSEHTAEGDVHVIRIGGYVDFDVAPQLKKRIVQRIESGEQLLVIDLSDAGFVDSTAIGVLVGALKRLRESGGALAVVCDNENVRGIFEVVGLESVIPLHRTREDALAALPTPVA
jgi:anti-sigma B factor antagonist